MSSGQTAQHRSGLNAIPEGLSLSAKFMLSETPDTSILRAMVPVYPNESIQTNAIQKLEIFVHYVSRTVTRPGSIDPLDRKSHILSYLPEWAIKWAPGTVGNTVCAGLMEDRLVLFVKRKDEVVYSKIHSFVTPEDVLYQVQSMFAECALDQERETIYLFGHLKEDSQVYRLLMIYYKNLLIAEMEFDS
ncbi:MAG TPA: DUF3822 family protein [Saprospiraceae bacterium]|nr:DUF3822 family protein [Saprospiraceae bacterium]